MEGLTPPGRTWLAGCIMHRDLPVRAPGAEVKINGRPFPALLDSDSAVSLIQPCILAPCRETKASLPIMCVHGEIRHVPVRRVTISAAPGAWPVELGVLKDLPVPVLLGRDWPGFHRLLAAAIQPIRPRESRRRKKQLKGARQHPVLLALDSGRDGESPQTRPNPFLHLYQQVTGGGSFAKDQREDDRLKHCWTHVCMVEGKETHKWTTSSPAFHCPGTGLLYCVVQRRGEEKSMLVVPRMKT